MGAFFHGIRIYREKGKDVRRPLTFLFDHVLDAHSSKGAGLDFDDRTPKTYVRLTHNRDLWLLCPISRFRKQWACAENGQPQWNFEFSEH